MMQETMKAVQTAITVSPIIVLKINIYLTMNRNAANI